MPQGVHLGQPEDCPDHVYQVMKTCWEKEATERPNFTTIKAGFKQEVMSQHEVEVLVKQPLYQNTGGSTEELKSRFVIGTTTKPRHTKEIICIYRLKDGVEWGGRSVIPSNTSLCSLLQKQIKKSLSAKRSLIQPSTI